MIDRFIGAKEKNKWIFKLAIQLIRVDYSAREYSELISKVFFYFLLLIKSKIQSS